MEECLGSGRKRRKMTMSDISDEEMKKMTKRELRALRNRESAYKSRMKKRREMENLRKRVEELEHENASLRRRLNKCDDGEGNRDDLKRIQVWRQSSADLYATTLGFSRKRSRNEYEDIVATNFETLQQSRNRIH